VLIEHRGLCSLAATAIAVLQISPASHVLQFASFSFDAAVWEVFPPLLAGATLVLAPREALLPGDALLETLRRFAITTATLPPSVLAVLPSEALPALTTLVTAGEACTDAIVARWAPGRRLLNGYGPTENTVGATITAPLVPGERPSIGPPMANVQTYVLDPRLAPMPVGVFGELHLGGVQLARGYLGRPALTAARFVPDPFAAVPGARLYKTGDLVRWQPDGTLDFRGRIDHQVKMRGFRIELGEVEAALLAHEGVGDAVALAREDLPGDKRLAAYVVPRGGGAPDVAALREFVRARLPEHMVPSAFVVLAALPLTPNGKVDRKALPAPDLAATTADAYVAPRGPFEEVLAAIFAEVLGARSGRSAASLRAGTGPING